jgi:hypothetical protein
MSARIASHQVRREWMAGFIIRQELFLRVRKAGKPPAFALSTHPHGRDTGFHWTYDRVIVLSLLLLSLTFSRKLQTLFANFGHESSKLRRLAMRFRTFVLIRTPISAVCLFGIGIALERWRIGDIGMMAVVGLLVFMGYVAVRLLQRRRGALRLAGWLLAAELLGAVGLVIGGDFIPTGGFLAALAVAGFVLALWTLPNTLILYTRRGTFTRSIRKKPGL